MTDQKLQFYIKSIIYTAMFSGVDLSFGHGNDYYSDFSSSV